MSAPLLKVRNLTVEYTRDERIFTAVNDVGFELAQGECLAIVGESGCGKSTIALAIIGLLPKNESRVPKGEILYDGKDLLKNTETDWQRTRGRRIAMVFQDPFSSLNPVLTIGYQLEECFLSSWNISIQDPRQGIGPGLRHSRARALLTNVQLSDPERILRSYPHQLSGGQRQRVMVAMALAQNPDLLIADEPTTALDVTVQDEIIKLLKSIRLATRMAMIFVTHNLGLVKNIADQVAVMRNGVIVETGDTAKILSTPTHPYALGLLRCMPTLHRSKGPLPTLEEAL